ncbi:MAG: CBS domain-containing protein [Phycisphaerae bacterium]
MNIMNFASRDVRTVTPFDSLDKTIALMEEAGIHHLVVMEDNRVVGMISDRDVLLSTGWLLGVERQVQTKTGPMTVGPTHVGQVMSRPAVTITNAETARDAALILVNRKIGALPVLANGRLVAIVTESDLLRWLRELAVGGNRADRLLQSPVRELMRAHVISVTSDTPLAEVIDLFRRYRVRHLPVIDNERLKGIISDRDVRRALGWSNVREMQADEEGRLIEVPHIAEQIMQSQLRTTTSAAPASDALRLMLEHHIHSLPVVDADQLVGIITQTDFIKTIAREQLL